MGHSDDEPELEEKYCAAYAVLLNNKVTEQLLELNEPSPFTSDQDFHEAVVMSLVRQSSYHSHGHKAYTPKGASMEEAIDEEEERIRQMPKLVEGTHILEHISEGVVPVSTPPVANHSPRQPSVTEVEDEEDVRLRSKPKAIDPRCILEVINESKGAEPPPKLHGSSESAHCVYNAHRNTINSPLLEDSPNTSMEFTLPFPALAVRIDQIVQDLTTDFYCVWCGCVQLPKSKIYAAPYSIPRMH